MFNKKGSKLRPAEVSLPLQVVPVGALYVKSFPILRKLKSIYRYFKIMFHFYFQPYMFIEN